MKRILPLVGLLFVLFACNRGEEEQGPLPTIAWDEPSGRYRIYANEALTLVPTIGHTDESSTYLWRLADRPVGTASNYTFSAPTAGTYFLKLRVTNRYGATEEEIKVTVEEAPATETPTILPNDTAFSWHFPWTEINMAQGRSLRVRPYFVENANGAKAQWTLDGKPVEGEQGGLAFVFHATTQGRHVLELSLRGDTLQVSQQLVVNVCPPAGTYRRASGGEALVNRVYQYMPAPGHWVNGYIIVGEFLPPNCTHEQACDSVLAQFRRNRMVSLGAQGGYLVAGFDHSVAAASGQELLVKGNPYNYQSEPGIIWVSQDDNGDGLPNDQWFELAGSEYGTPNHIRDYAIRYQRPTQARSAIAWQDEAGATDIVPYMSYWNPSPTYWQPWVEGTQRIYYGSRLLSHHTYVNGVSSMPPYAWGYADNQGSDYTDLGRYSISNARTWDGQPAHLAYIDFVRIQTAQTGYTPNLGDISTEVYSIRAHE